MRPTLAIIPLALLLSWISPSPSGELIPTASLGLSEARRGQEARVSMETEPSATEQFAQAWEAIQRGDFLQATSDIPQRR